MNNKRNIREFIQDKRAWNEPLSQEDEKLGFRGWRSRGYLPHFEAPGVRQMITYRLAYAMPANRRHEWEALLTIEDEREKHIKIESYLDAGHANVICDGRKSPRWCRRTCCTLMTRAIV
ncbi:MAG TPA: hypothetical protein VIK35_03110 [Verrucomicrobiae bacterium]